MDVKIMEITPDIANDWMKGNVKNRPISDKLVEAYANDMKSGNWCVNGESIKISFDVNGDPIVDDGQHRLLGVIKSNVTIRSVVVFNTDDKRFIDNGRSRSFKDSVQLGDISADSAWMRSNVISALSRFAIIHSTAGLNRATNAQVYEYMLANKQSLSFVYKMQAKVNRIKGLQKAAVWAAVKAAYDSGYTFTKLCEFCDVFISGEGKNEYHIPIIKFRNWCIANSGVSGSTGQKNAYMRAQYALRAFEIDNKTATTKMAVKEFYELK